jgi:hypothetical protein
MEYEMMLTKEKQVPGWPSAGSILSTKNPTWNTLKYNLGF